MARKQSRPPQEKKALSYAKDCRNVYNANDKASRKLIPLRKAAENRQDRRKVAQEVSSLAGLNEAAADLLESSVRHDVHRVGGWKKGADAPLGKIVGWAKETRESSVGRKARSRARQAKLQDSASLREIIFESDEPEALKRQAARRRRDARHWTHYARSAKNPEIANDLVERALHEARLCDERADEIMRERLQSGR